MCIRDRVIKEEDGKQKFKVAWATSSGLPYLLRGTLLLEYISLSFWGIFSVIEVLIGPGQIQLTVMPKLPNSTANDLVNPITPCLAEV